MAMEKKCGLTAIISKPCEPEIVLRIVDDALNGRPIEPPATASENFDREHLQLLTDQLSRKANQFSVANQKLTALCGSCQELRLEREPPRLLDKYCEFARELVGAKWAALALAGDDGKTLRHFHTIGLDQGMSTMLESNMTTNPVLREVTGDHLPWCTNNHSSAGLPEEFSGLSSLLIVPLIFQDKVEGWLCLADKLGASEFEDTEQELVVTLAAHMAVAYDNAMLLENTRRQSQEIESQRQRLNDIVTSVPGVVWETWGQPDAATQRISFVSDYVETMLGYDVDEWLSTPNFWLAIVHPDDREEAANTASASFAGGKPSAQEFRWVAKDRRVVWVESNYVVVADDEGRPAGLRGVTLDITERKKLEEQLRQAQKMEAIGTLAGGIAHDFNNILAAIIGYSELAKMGVIEVGRAHAHLEEVLKASARARDLVRQILTFSRQEEQDRETLQLHPIIDETLKLLRASL